MKVIKIIFGLGAAFALLVGGFVAGTFISRTRTGSAPVQQFAQPNFIPQQQFQPTVVPDQSQATRIPSQGQWQPGWGMMNPNYVPQGEWEHGWMMDPDHAPQGQQGWGMHHWNGNNGNGMHGGMMNGYGWQSNPNWNTTPPVPNSSQTYPTPSTPVSFKNDVGPIFAARCVACHGGTNGLFLNTYDNVLKGGANGPVVIPGDVYNSRLAYYVYIGYMPFRNTPLTSKEIQTILDWIAAGALNN